MTDITESTRNILPCDGEWWLVVGNDDEPDVFSFEDDARNAAKRWDGECPALSPHVVVRVVRSVDDKIEQLAKRLYDDDGTPFRGASAHNPTSQLSPPTLHWGTVGPNGDTCDLCPATIKPYGDCFVSIRRAFEIQNGRLVVETEPIKVVMCVECGWTRPYAPVPRSKPLFPLRGAESPQTGTQTPDEALGEGAPYARRATDHLSDFGGLLDDAIGDPRD